MVCPHTVFFGFKARLFGGHSRCRDRKGDPGGARLGPISGDENGLMRSIRTAAGLHRVCDAVCTTFSRLSSSAFVLGMSPADCDACPPESGDDTNSVLLVLAKFLGDVAPDRGEMPPNVQLPADAIASRIQSEPHENTCSWPKMA